MVALEVLAITFLVLLLVGLSIYTSFFILNKVYMKRLTKLMSRYNKLASVVHSINFYKIEILIKSELPIKIDLDNLKNELSLLSDNVTRIHQNLVNINNEIEIMNLKTAKAHLINADKSIAVNEQYASNIKKQYDDYTSYGDTIDEIVQTYQDIYKNLKDFYSQKIKLNKNFKIVNDLFLTISLTISKIYTSKIKFDFKKTINIILDLKKKLIALVNAIEIILKLQIVFEYLQKTKHSNDLFINENASSIETQDLQWIQKMKNQYKLYLKKFVEYYLSLDFNSAKNYAVKAAEVMKQITNFVYVHGETPQLIKFSLQELNKQTSTILKNKGKIIEAIKNVNKYFIKDPSVALSLKNVQDDLNSIESLSSLTNVIYSKTYTEKITAVRQIAKISDDIYKKKASIKESLNKVNESLSNIIQVISDLNNLYIYFWQLLVLLKRTLKHSEIKDIETIIKNNLNLINDFTKEIVMQKQPNYSLISKNVINMEQNTQQLTEKLIVSTKLKTYASKLFVYANQFKTEANLSSYDQIAKLYKNNEYAKCIDELIKIIKKPKKGKKYEIK